MSRGNPFDEIERMFDQLSSQFESLEPVDIGAGSHPPIDLHDEGDRFVVVVDLAGYDSEDIEVTLSDEHTLTVSAERETAASADEDGLAVRTERRESVRRTIRLPDPVDEGETTATHENGVLQVTLPRRSADEDDGQSIPVQ